jgi:hypothetical protein
MPAAAGGLAKARVAVAQLVEPRVVVPVVVGSNPIRHLSRRESGRFATMTTRDG